MFGEILNLIRGGDNPYRHDDSTCPDRNYRIRASEPHPLAKLRDVVAEAIVRLDTDPTNIYIGARALFAPDIDSIDSKVNINGRVMDIVVGYYIIRREKDSGYWETIERFRLSPREISSNPLVPSAG